MWKYYKNIEKYQLFILKTTPLLSKKKKKKKERKTQGLTLLLTLNLDFIYSLLFASLSLSHTHTHTHTRAKRERERERERAPRRNSLRERWRDRRCKGRWRSSTHRRWSSSPPPSACVPGWIRSACLFLFFFFFLSCSDLTLVLQFDYFYEN